MFEKIKTTAKDEVEVHTWDDESMSVARVYSAFKAYREKHGTFPAVLLISPDVSLTFAYSPGPPAICGVPVITDYSIEGNTVKLVGRR